MSLHSKSMVELGRLFVDLTERLQFGGVQQALELICATFSAEGLLFTADCRNGLRAPLREIAGPMGAETVEEMLCGARAAQEIAARHFDEANQMRYGLRLLRSAAGPAFEPDEAAMLETLLIHLARNLEHALSRMNADVEHALYSEVIGRLQIGLIVLDRAGRVLSTSQRASELLDYRDGLAMVQGRLVASNALEDRKFQEALRATLAEAASGKIGAPRGLSLTKRGTMRKMGVILRALRVEGAQNRAAVSLSIRDADVAPDVGPHMMRQIFDLTPAEAAVAGRLTEGLSLEDTALALDISHNTARAHLRSIFSKSGINRQTELVRLILNSAVIL